MTPHWRCSSWPCSYNSKTIHIYLIVEVICPQDASYIFSQNMFLLVDSLSIHFVNVISILKCVYLYSPNFIALGLNLNDDKDLLYICFISKYSRATGYYWAVSRSRSHKSWWKVEDRLMCYSDFYILKSTQKSLSTL